MDRLPFLSWKCLFSLFSSASPLHHSHPECPWGGLGGAKYLGSLPAGRPDSAERPGRLQTGMEGGDEGGGGGAECGASISLSDDKLTLGKMYVMSHQSQLIKSLAAPSSFLCPSLPTQTEELRLKAPKTKHSQKEIRISDGFKGFYVLLPKFLSVRIRKNATLRKESDHKLYLVAFPELSITPHDLFSSSVGEKSADGSY